MAELISESEHSELRQQLKTGSMSIQVARSVALRFFTHVGAASVKDVTGRSNILEKALVVGLIATSLLVLISSLGLMVVEFSWFAIISVTLTGIFWTILNGLTLQFGNLWSSSALVIVCLIGAFYLPEAYRLPSMLFVVSVYLYRLASLLAEHLLTRLVTQSYPAFEMLHQQFDVIDHEN